MEVYACFLVAVGKFGEARDICSAVTLEGLGGLVLRIRDSRVAPRIVVYFQFHLRVRPRRDAFRREENSYGLVQK